MTILLKTLEIKTFLNKKYVKYSNIINVTVFKAKTKMA